MKALLLSLLLLASPAFALEPSFSGGCEAPLSASFTYALNSAAVGVSSAAIDVGAVSVIYVNSTGTAGQNTGVVYSWSDDGITFSSGGSDPTAHGTWCLAKRSRYLNVKGTGSAAGFVSVKYALATVTSGTISGDVGITGPALAGITTSTNTLLSISNSAASLAAKDATRPLGTRAAPVAVTLVASTIPVSSTAQLALNATTVMTVNLSHTAGSAANPLSIVFGSTGPSAGFRWKMRACTEAAMGVNNGFYLAASNTVKDVNLSPGNCYDFVGALGNQTLEFVVIKEAQ